MDDELSVGCGHGPCDLSEDHQSVLDGQCIFVAVRCHGQSIDVLHDKVRHALGVDTAVEQIRNVGVSQIGEDLSLPDESVVRGGRGEVES